MISILEMIRNGKTTLARRLYNDPWVVCCTRFIVELESLALGLPSEGFTACHFKVYE